MRKNRVFASPRARREMRRRSLNSATIRGSGPNGRIVEMDVIGFKPPQGFAAGEIAKRPESHVSANISPMRRAVAAKVAESFATVPHFYLRSKVDVTSLVQLRQQNLEAFEKCCGTRPSLTDFLLRAMALALRDCPAANRIWRDGGIVPLPEVDVGLVVQVGDGLLVPIIHGADRLGLLDLVRQRIKLTEAVRSGRAPGDVFQGGATSLTNLGKHRVDEFAAIISPPQSSMLAVGRVAERAASFDGKLCSRQMMTLTLSVDHRVMDGVPAAEFLDRIVDLLERSFILLCDMPAVA